jgi:ATP phosphoribosyltransferase regulatory subunit
MPRWLLPENISDLLPSEARAVEELRRRLLDLYRSYGYELVMPPMLEYLESLLTGFGGDMSERTFQLVDQLSGRTLGLRSDMTPQVARIDAHLLNRKGLARLCYAGSVLHTRPAGLFASREPMQIGAELYGHAGIEADLEIADLMIASLRLAGAGPVRIDLCHVGIVPALLALDPSVDAETVYALLQQKDRPGLSETLVGAVPEVREALLALVDLYGMAQGAGGARSDAVSRARAALPDLPAIREALDVLDALSGSPMWARHPEVTLSVDLADLRGYRYHTGITFAAYVDRIPNAVGRGGRYDHIGRAFGRARPATGFSLELRELAALAQIGEPAAAIRAPWSEDPRLAERVTQLRAAGEIVVRVLPGHEHEEQEFACDRELVLENGAWSLRAL